MRCVEFKLTEKYYNKLKNNVIHKTIRDQYFVNSWLKVGKNIVLRKVHDTTRTSLFDYKEALVERLEFDFKFKDLSKQEQKDMLFCYGDTKETKSMTFYKIFFRLIE